MTHKISKMTLKVMEVAEVIKAWLEDSEKMPGKIYNLEVVNAEDYFKEAKKLVGEAYRGGAIWNYIQDYFGEEVNNAAEIYLEAANGFGDKLLQVISRRGNNRDDMDDVVYELGDRGLI